MALGDTAKKLQTVADTAEKLYKRLNDLRDQLQTVSERVESTNEQVERIEADLDDQRALLVALAERDGIDTETLLGADTEPAPTPDEPADAEVAGEASGDRIATNDDGTAVTNTQSGDGA
jgi:DNA anti-recombination protein RmuC